MNAQPVGPVPAGYTDHDAERLYLTLDPDDYRTRFGRDYDRLVHTSAFRRLQGKTQVISPGEADFFRTRLTHSIEVAQLSRRLGEILGASPDLCEAAAILHDLGHPPFGHVGEEALKHVLDETAHNWRLNPITEVGGFNGNAQSFRLAVKSLSQSHSFEGLDLTRGVLDGAVKYPYLRSQRGVQGSSKRWCFYPTEQAEATWMRQGVPPARRFEKSMEAQIVEWADDVAYSIHDLEDWYRAGFMPLEMLAQSSVFRDEFAKAIAPGLVNAAFNAPQVEAETRALFASPTFAGFTRAYDGSAEVKKAIRLMRKDLFTKFTNVQVAASGTPARRHENDLHVDPLVRLQNGILKQLLWEFVIDHPRMATHQMGQRKVAEELFTLHIDALHYDPSVGRIDSDKAELEIYPPDLRDALCNPKATPPDILRLVADRVSGMTDEYAVRLHARLTGSAPGIFNAFV